METEPVEVSLVVPTFNERTNVEPLLAEIAASLGSLSWEAVFVDDSRDGTEDVLARLARHDPRLRVLHRNTNSGGLSGAVVAGLDLARGRYVCVLDADLQHPPAQIPLLLAAARQRAADVAVASRYVPGGGADGLDGPLRRACSGALRLLARAAFPRRLSGVGDPLGGFFLVRRDVFRRAPLRPMGYKILLELLVRGDRRTVVEVPYRFRRRLREASKADLRQGLRFLRHLSLLFWDCSPLCALLRSAPAGGAGGAGGRPRGDLTDATALRPA